MKQQPSKPLEIAVATLSGLLVGVIAAGVYIATVPRDSALLVQVAAGDFVAALTAMIVCLGVQLRREEVHYQNPSSGRPSWPNSITTTATRLSSVPDN